MEETCNGYSIKEPRHPWNPEDGGFGPHVLSEKDLRYAPIAEDQLGEWEKEERLDLARRIKRGDIIFADYPGY